MNVITSIELLGMFVGIPAIVVVIAMAASKGKPKRFDREMYWTAFAASGALSAIVFYGTTKIKAIDFGGYLLSALLFMSALALFGMSTGCGVSVFVYRRPRAANGTEDPGR